MAEFRINANIDGVGRIAERVRKVGAGMDAARKPATLAMARRVQEAARENLRDPSRHAAIIWRYPLIPRHWIQYDDPPGMSGSSPVSQSGRLAASIVVKQTAAGNATVVAGEGLPRPYAKWLELGFTTALAGRSVKFPFLRPALEQVTPELTGIVMDVLRGFI